MTDATRIQTSSVSHAPKTVVFVWFIQPNVAVHEKQTHGQILINSCKQEVRWDSKVHQQLRF